MCMAGVDVYASVDIDFVDYSNIDVEIALKTTDNFALAARFDEIANYLEISTCNYN